MNRTSVIPAVLAGAAIALSANALPASALTFNFEGQDENGTGSAKMQFSTDGGSFLTVDLWNTSPITTSTGAANAPGITAFGFSNVSGQAPPVIEQWVLEALDINNQLVKIGSSSNDCGSISCLWKLGTFSEGVKLDYLPNITGVQGALYNPEATEGLAATPNFFTQAIFTAQFASKYTLDNSSTYVRMKNVGDNGEGSLKLWGTPTDNGTVSVPEPFTILGTIVALGFGGLFQRERSKRQQEAMVKA